MHRHYDHEWNVSGPCYPECGDEDTGDVDATWVIGSVDCTRCLDELVKKGQFATARLQVLRENGDSTSTALVAVRHQGVSG